MRKASALSARSSAPSVPEFVEIHMTGLAINVEYVKKCKKVLLLVLKRCDMSEYHDVRTALEVIQLDLLRK